MARVQQARARGQITNARDTAHKTAGTELAVPEAAADETSRTMGREKRNEVTPSMVVVDTEPGITSSEPPVFRGIAHRGRSTTTGEPSRLLMS